MPDQPLLSEHWADRSSINVSLWVATYYRFFPLGFFSESNVPANFLQVGYFVYYFIKWMKNEMKWKNANTNSTL